MAQEGLNYVNETLLDPEYKNKYLYNGKEQDGQTKFFEYGFREYDSQLGRWHCPDAMAEIYMSVSPYAYVANNPINYIDPFGLWAVAIDEDGGNMGGGGGISGSMDLPLNWIPGEDNNLSGTSTNYNIIYPYGTSFGQFNNGGGDFSTGGDPSIRMTGNGRSNPPDGGDRVHVVRKDETLYSLSKRYGVTVEALREANPNIRNNEYGNPEIFEYFPGKEKPLSWEGVLPPLWYVTKVIIPGGSEELLPSPPRSD